MTIYEVYFRNGETPTRICLEHPAFDLIPGGKDALYLKVRHLAREQSGNRTSPVKIIRYITREIIWVTTVGDWQKNHPSDRVGNLEA